MASCIKRLKGCIGPFFIVYTVLVTYFLAQRAWDDVSTRLRRLNDVKFLDVLVQEERRHLRSFQDVVKSYRGDVHIKIGNKANEHDNEDYKLESKHPRRDMGLRSGTDTEQLQLGPISQEFERYDNEDGVYNDTYFPKDLRLRLEHEAQDNRPPRPIFKVEVEEWDSNAVQSKQPAKAFNISHERSTRSGIEVRSLNGSLQDGDVNVDNSKMSVMNHHAVQPQTSGNVHGGAPYTQFCDNVIEVLGLQPIICKRELAENGGSLHLNISTYSSPFRKLGNIFVFSAFLDTRDTSYLIRLITLGPQGHDKKKSVFWCVFYLRSSTPSTKSKTMDRQMSNRQATQLTYYSASDGHHKDNQFYMMSCPVPEAAKTSLLPPYRGFFQVVIGNLERPFLERSQISLTLRVIRNKAESTLPPFRVEPQDRSYFDKMEQDLLTLSVPGITGINNKLNNISSTISMNNKIHSSVVASNDIKEVIEIENVRNITDDKIVTCVAPLQGNIGVVQLVEFIELTLLLGSQHVVFYTFQVVLDIRKVLYMYEGRGLVTVLPWNLPVPDSVWASGRDMALNDCLYRTMHVYDYALFLDLDEFLVPRVTPDLPSFLKYLKAVHRFNSTKYSDLVFSSAYFPPPTKAQHKNLTTLSGFTRDVNKFVSLKSVYRTYFNPKHSTRMIRLCKAFRVGAGERKRTSFTISSRFAVVNHYRYCPQDYNAGSKNNTSMKQERYEKNAEDICSHTKQDLIMWRYKSVLIQRVKDSVRRLNRG